ncbi:branched-chain amino acid ABC transporter permease [Oceaniradius stylonematis]|uniref:Branched-chain amino acid ABC transporter permease n=1 Tax=Oceaniradius stylonematis TaxID=2184161 RepID=A0A3A8A6S3_9HYPH|nr:branched-chain amino acid ABC transporter permease [Oceaniradius stylonematis]RKF05982.1 branched-chain amino acid ABC transporter permease [Oceaniradius stylonematis]
MLAGELNKHLAIALVIAVGFAAVPLFVGERYLLGEVIVFFIWAMVAMNWNLLMGHAGVFSLAQLLFFACGAYGVAMGTQLAGLSIWLAIPLAAFAAMVLALLIGLACLRLTGAYVALLTFAIAEMVRILIVTDTHCFALIQNNCQQLFGGSTGFSRFSDFGFRPILRGDWIVGHYYVVWAVFVLSLVALVVIIHGRLGLAFRAIRDNVGYASSRGIDRQRYQLIAFASSALLTGLAGAVYAGHFRFAGPSLFEFSTLMFVLAMVIVGGLGSTWGPLVGAGVMMIVVEFAKELGDARSIVLGLSIVLFVVFLPKGIAGGVGGLRAIISRPAGQNRSTTATDTHQ